MRPLGGILQDGSPFDGAASLPVLISLWLFSTDLVFLVIKEHDLRLWGPACCLAL